MYTKLRDAIVIRCYTTKKIWMEDIVKGKAHTEIEENLRARSGYRPQNGRKLLISRRGTYNVRYTTKIIWMEDIVTGKAHTEIEENLRARSGYRPRKPFPL